MSSLLAQMGLTCGCQRRAVLEPSPEPEPVLTEGPDSPASSLISDQESSTAVSVEEPTADQQEEPAAQQTAEPRGSSENHQRETVALQAAVPGVRLDLSRVDTVDWSDPAIRIYSVWVIPKARAPTLFAGIHSGRDLSAYAGILGLNQGAFEGIRWRRCQSREQAVEVYWREADRFGLAHRPLQYFRWQSQ